jgi:hypothetical protein
VSRDRTPATEESLDALAQLLERALPVLERIADAVEEIAEQGRDPIPPEATP